MRLLGKISLALVTLLYPFAIYFGLQTFSLRYLLLLLVCLALFRLFNWRSADRLSAVIWCAVIACLVALSLWTNTELGLLLYPVAVNGSLLLVFALSLRQPQSLVERLARLQEPDLPEAAVAYTRKVTILWVCFFLCNGSVALYTVWLGNHELWLLYNGFIAYLCIGLLAAGEWLVRRKVKAKIAAGLTT